MYKLYNYLNNNLIIIITIISYLYLSYNLYYKNYNIIFIYFFFLLIGYFIFGIKIYYFNFIIIISDFIYKLLYKKIILIKENMSNYEWNKKKKEKEKDINQQEKPTIDLNEDDAKDSEKKMDEKNNEEKQTPNNFLYK